MRAFVLLPCLVVAALVLQGCGAGGSASKRPVPGPVTQDCVNTLIDIKSQSIESTNKLTVSATVGKITTKEVVDATATEKLDVEQMNLYEHSTSTISSTVSGGPPGLPGAMDLKVDSKAILNVAKKLVVEWTKVTNASSGIVLKTDCTAQTIAKMPPVTTIVLAFKAIVLPQLQQASKCQGNDGAYDHYHLIADYAGPIPGVPKVTNLKVKGTMDVVLDKDYLLQTSKSQLTGSATETDVGDIAVTENSDTTATSSVAGGPTAADLDWSSWTADGGKCKQQMMEDIDDLFKPAMTSEITKKFNNKAFFKNQLLASIQGVLKVSETKKLIV